MPQPRTLAPRASTAQRTCLFAVCVLLLLAVSCLPTPALGSSLLLGGGGFVLSRPLLLQGVDVGAVLSSVQVALQTAQEDIAEQKLRNAQLQGDLTLATAQLSLLQRSDLQQSSSLSLHAAQLTELQQSVAGNASALEALTVRVSAAEGNVAEHSDRLTAAEDSLSSQGGRLTSAEGNLTALGVRLTAAESLSGVATPLSSTPTALRDLTAGSPLTDAVLGMRDLSTTTTPLALTLLALRDFTPTAYAGYRTLEGLRALTPGSPLTDAVLEQGTRLTTAEGAAAALADRLTTDEGNIAALSTRVTDAEGAAVTLTTRVGTAESGLTGLTTRVSAAENLNGTATTLSTTVLALRDLTGGSTLVNTVTGLRDNSGSSALVTTLGSLRNKTDSSSALIRSLPCYGETNLSAWEVFPYNAGKSFGLYVNVSMSACGFTAPPQHVSASLYGITDHWLTTGASSVYLITATSFRIYLMPVHPDRVSAENILAEVFTPAQAANMNWINWMAAR